MCGGDWSTEWQKLWGKIIKVLDKWAAEISDGRNSGAGLPSVEFIFFKNYIKLELIPLMGVPRQVCTWLHHVSACVCLPLQISVPTVACVCPAPSSVTCFASQAAAPCGPGERCTTARQTDAWKFHNRMTTSWHPRAARRCLPDA